MFSFRRKAQRKQSSDNGPPYIRTSPSLPDLSAQGIQWPESLVDVSELPKMKLQPVNSQPGASALSFILEQQGAQVVPVAVNLVNGKASGPISALYMSHPPSAFENRKSKHMRRHPSNRKNRNPATFNIMVRQYLACYA